jgi:hypothetical protein
MVCGRRKDLSSILQLLIEGKSVMLFGERRIGKTLTLYLLRDIIDGSISEYKAHLLDQDLFEWLRELPLNLPALGQLNSCVFLSLQSLERRSIESLAKSLKKKFSLLSDESTKSLFDIFQKLDSTLSGRLVILLDEMEELLDSRFKDPGLVFQQLNSAIQTCKNVCFVFAGADNWARAVREGTSPLYGNCSTHFLKSPNEDSIRTYLLTDPLSDFITKQQDRGIVVGQILIQTGGKPYYCQALAYEIASGSTIDEAIETADTVLRNSIQDFFTDPPDPGPSILALLSHRPLLTESDIGRALISPKQELLRTLADLKLLGKVSYKNGFYSVNGKLFEDWGKHNLDKPKRPSSRFPALKWSLRGVGAIAAVLAIAVIAYTHPERANFSCPIKQGLVVLSLPATVERGEEGEGSLYVTAGTSGCSKIRVIALGSVGEIWAKETEPWEFSELRSDERSQPRSVYFRIPHDASDSYASFKLVTQADPETMEFHVPIRRFPLKRYWAIFAIFAAAFGVLVGVAEIIIKVYDPFALKK